MPIVGGSQETEAESARAAEWDGDGEGGGSPPRVARELDGAAASGSAPSSPEASVIDGGEDEEETAVRLAIELSRRRKP